MLSNVSRMYTRARARVYVRRGPSHLCRRLRMQSMYLQRREIKIEHFPGKNLTESHFSPRRGAAALLLPRIFSMEYFDIRATTTFDTVEIDNARGEKGSRGSGG